MWWWCLQLVYMLLMGVDRGPAAQPPAVILFNSAHVINAALNVR